MATHTRNTNWAKVGQFDPQYYGPYGWNTPLEICDKIKEDFARYEKENPLKFRRIMVQDSFAIHRGLKDLRY